MSKNLRDAYVRKCLARTGNIKYRLDVLTCEIAEMEQKLNEILGGKDGDIKTDAVLDTGDTDLSPVDAVQKRGVPWYGWGDSPDSKD